MCKINLLFFISIILLSCITNDEERLQLKVGAYFQAWNRQDFTHPDFVDFQRDTIKMWHNEKVGDGIISIYNPDSEWKQWDVAWNGRYRLDSIEVDLDKRTLKGRFSETNDFNVLIGMPEGYSATVTYWLDESDKITEILYDWDEVNPVMKEKLKPIVTWALKNDSIRIAEVYLKNGFRPSANNARIWKGILEKYLMSTGGHKN